MGFKYLQSLLLTALFLSEAVANGGTRPPAGSLPPDFQGTVRRHFASGSDYDPRDLITRTQFEQFQRYLRRTQGNSPLTHPRLLKLFLADNARLSRLFYSAGGKQFFRPLAEQIGYGPLDALCRTSAGLILVKNCFKAGDAAPILEAIRVRNTRSEQLIESVEPESDGGASKEALLYTVEEFLEYVTEAEHSDAESPQSDDI